MRLRGDRRLRPLGLLLAGLGLALPGAVASAHAPGAEAEWCPPAGSQEAYDQLLAAAPDGGEIEAEAHTIADEARAEGTFEDEHTLLAFDDLALDHGYFFDCDQNVYRYDPVAASGGTSADCAELPADDSDAGYDPGEGFDPHAPGAPGGEGEAADGSDACAGGSHSHEEEPSSEAPPQHGLPLEERVRPSSPAQGTTGVQGTGSPAGPAPASPMRVTSVPPGAVAATSMPTAPGPTATTAATVIPDVGSVPSSSLGSPAAAGASETETAAAAFEPLAAPGLIGVPTLAEMSAGAAGPMGLTGDVQAETSPDADGSAQESGPSILMLSAVAGVAALAMARLTRSRERTG